MKHENFVRRESSSFRRYRFAAIASPLSLRRYRFAAIASKAFLPSHVVTIVPSLAAARLAQSQSAFDVVLVDFDLDDGKGDKLVAEMQNQAKRAVIIAVSSHAAGNQALSEAGADAVCSKMDFQNIEAVIAETCAARRR